MPDPLEDALGGGEPEPNATDAGTAEPAAAFDPSQHQVVQTRFGGDVQKALDAYASLDREFGQQGQRLGQQVQALEQQIAALQEQRQPEPEEPPAGGYDDQQLPDMGVDQLREWIENEPADAMAYLLAQSNQMLRAQMQAEMQAQFDARLKPIEATTGRQAASSLVDGLKKAVGDDVVARNVDVLQGLMKTDPDLFKADPQLVFQRTKAAVLAADAERGGTRRAAQNGAAATPDVAVMGGSQGRNPQSATDEPTEAEEFVAAMLDTADGRRDIVGNPIRTR